MSTAAGMNSLPLHVQAVLPALRERSGTDDGRSRRWLRAGGHGSRSRMAAERGMSAFRKLSRTAAALMSVAITAVMIVTLAVEPVSAGQEEVPVFVIGADGGLSPFVIWRDSQEFKEVVFPPVARALARKGFRVIGEEPFRARFGELDGVPGDRHSRWDSLDFLHFAREVSVDGAGNTAPYMVILNIWRRVCRDDANAVCVDIGSYVHDTASRKRLFFGPGAEVSIPIPPGCGTADCIRSLWPSRAEALLDPVGTEIGTLISRHIAEGADPNARQPSPR